MDVNNKRILATSILILLVCGVYLFTLESKIKEMNETNKIITEENSKILKQINEVETKIKNLEAYKTELSDLKANSDEARVKKLAREEILTYIKEQEAIEEQAKKEREERIAQKKLELQKQQEQQGNHNKIIFDEGDKVYGSRDAQFSIYVFSDLDCPYCAKMHQQVLDLVDSSKGNVNLIYRHFPLQIHGEQSVVKSLMAECAGYFFDDKGFWKAIGLLFEGKGYDDFRKIFQLTDEQMSKCVKDKKIQDIVIRQAKEGEELNVNSTPTFFILDRIGNQRFMLTDVQNAGQIKQTIAKMALAQPAKNLQETTEAN